MERLFKIKKGLDLKLVGEAPQTNVREAAPGKEYAVCPTDFHGVQPKLVVKEGDQVLAGSPLFVDKATESVRFVAPVSGRVVAIERGERRKLLRIRIAADNAQVAKDFGVVDLNKANAESIQKLLLESGLFGMLRQRPYDVIPSPQEAPKAIFISAFSKMPLAANFAFTVQGEEDDFKNGVKALTKVAKVHVGISPEQINTGILPLEEAEVSVFSGPNPAGNVSVHINHVDPVNKGEVVWTMAPEDVVILGRLLRTGKIDMTRTIAVAGSEVKEPCYIKTKVGAALSDILNGQLETTEHKRIINGNPLVGCKSDINGFLGAHTSEVCVLPEGDDVNELFGWIAPRLKEFSTSRSYFSWLMGKQHPYAPDCRIKGGERHMIMSGEYDRVFPMDIYAGYLVKAIICGDIDRQEALGIYEVAPEDFALPEFVDSSKLELQRIVREGLEILRKENA